MKSNKVIFIAIAGVCISVAFVIVLYLNQNKWYLTLDDNGHPFDLDFLIELIEESNQDDKVHYLKKNYQESIQEVSDTNANLFQFRHYSQFDSTEIQLLLDFVNRGNNAFIINEEFNPFLLAKLHYASLDSNFDYTGDYHAITFGTDSIIADSINNFNIQLNKKIFNHFSNLSLESSSPPYVSIDNDSTSVYMSNKYGDTLLMSLNYFNYDSTSLNAEVIGTLNGKPNFIKINYGKGTFYLHSNSLPFTNYHLNRPSTLAYVSQVFSKFNNGNIYIDVYEHKVNNGLRDRNSRNSDLAKSPLAFILSIPALKWAWYLLLLSSLVFVIFRSKRNQRTIPVISPLKNNSLEYSKTVGRLFYKERNNKRMAQEVCLYFFTFLRKRYHISTKNFDEYSKQRFIKLFPREERRINIIAHLSIKSFKEATEVSPKELEDLYEATRYFILKAK